MPLDPLSIHPQFYTHTRTHTYIEYVCMPRRIMWASLMMNIGRMKMSSGGWWHSTVADPLETNSKAQNSSYFSSILLVCVCVCAASIAWRCIHPDSRVYKLHFHEIWLYVFTKLMAIARRLSAIRLLSHKQKQEEKNIERAREESIKNRGVRTTFLCFITLFRARKVSIFAKCELFDLFFFFFYECGKWVWDLYKNRNT